MSTLPIETARDAAGGVDGSRRSALHEAVDAGARVIRVVHSDLFGRQRGKQFPASELASLLGGVAYSKMSLAEDLMGRPVSEEAFPQLLGHPDLHALVDVETARVPPWESDAVWVLARLFENGGPSPLCARSALAQAEARLTAETGLASVSAGEPEFYLFHQDRLEGRPQPYARDGVSYTMDRITDPRGVLGRIHRRLIDFGIGVTALNREFSPSQFEVNLLHGASLAAADQAFLLKTALKELAIGEGFEANFMAKPLSGEEGSSLHVHLSLWDGERNVLDGGAELSDTARHAIAGLQTHAPALLAFAAPTINSYKRLTGNGLSPRRSDWGEDNRYCLIRVPAERGKATRVELRAGDASASPHLLIAGMVHAVRDGILRQLEPRPVGEPLPRSLSASIAALQGDAAIADGFGDEFVSIYSAIKTAEIEAFSAAVTDWEWNHYGPAV